VGIKEHIAALIRKQFPHHYVIVKDDTIYLAMFRSHNYFIHLFLHSYYKMKNSNYKHGVTIDFQIHVYHLFILYFVNDFFMIFFNQMERCTTNIYLLARLKNFYILEFQ
jgi:hypothetical protein